MTAQVSSLYVAKQCWFCNTLKSWALGRNTTLQPNHPSFNLLHLKTQTHHTFNVLVQCEVSAHLHDHLHRGQGGGNVLGVWRSHGDWHTARVQAAVKRRNQVYPCTESKESLPWKSNRLITDSYVSINNTWNRTQKVKWVTKPFNRLLLQPLVCICSASLLPLNCTVLSMKNRWHTKLQPDINI